MKNFFTKKRIVIGAIVFAVALAAAGAVYGAQLVNRITNDPRSLFNQTAGPAITDGDTSAPDDQSASGDPDETETPEPAPTPTLSPYEELSSQADKSITQAPLNIMLIGIDWAEERVGNKEDYVNKDFNSDVMLDLAIDFENNKVDMISLPRDSYAKIVTTKGPTDGIYKLNFSLTAGGGMNDAGFMSVCKSVQYLFDEKGSIPINYYIAVTMPTVKALTDAIGGVDYNMDVDFTIDGRSYKKGMLHMDGQAVLDYCRIRKGELSSGFGDLNRVNRQKNILLAVFKKLKSSASIFDVPKILTSMAGNVYTNLDFSQLAALAVFGSRLPEKNIAMYTMPGFYEYGIFNKNYVLIDQTKRVQLMKDVFGSTVGRENRYSSGTARLLWAYMQGSTYVKAIDGVIGKEAKLPDGQKKLIDPALNTRLAELEAATKTMLSKYKSRANSGSSTSKTQYTELQNQVKSLYTLASSMFKNAGYKVSWTVPIYKKGQLKMKE